MAKGGYIGGSTMINVGVDPIGGRSKPRGPRVDLGPSVQKLQKLADQADKRVKRLEGKLTKLKAELRDAERIRQDAHSQLNSTRSKRRT